MAQEFVNLLALSSDGHQNSQPEESPQTLLHFLRSEAHSFEDKCGILLLEVLTSHNQAQEYKRGLKKLNMPLITRILSRNGIDIETRLISMMLNWKRAVGETYYQATLPQRYDKRNKKLYLHVKHSTWANHLTMTRNTFIASLHEKLPQFQIEDILSQFKQLTRRDWKEHTGMLSGFMRQNYSGNDKAKLLQFLETKQITRRLTPADRSCCQAFLRRFLDKEYKNNPLIKELVLFNAPASFMKLAQDWEIHQHILKEELLQTVESKPLASLNHETLRNVAHTSKDISDPELRTAFTELMSYAKRSGLAPLTASPSVTPENLKDDSEAND